MIIYFFDSSEEHCTWCLGSGPSGIRVDGLLDKFGSVGVWDVLVPFSVTGWDGEISVQYVLETIWCFGRKEDRTRTELNWAFRRT